MNENNRNNPQEKSTKSIGGLIIGIACMILGVLIGYQTSITSYTSNNFGILFFVGLGFLVYYLK